MTGHDEVAVRRITKPSMQVKVSICTSDQLPLSEPAKVVSDLLAELGHKFAEDHQSKGVQAIPRQVRTRKNA